MKTWLNKYKLVLIILFVVISMIGAGFLGNYLSKYVYLKNAVDIEKQIEIERNNNLAFKKKVDSLSKDNKEKYYSYSKTIKEKDKLILILNNKLKIKSNEINNSFSKIDSSGVDPEFINFIYN